MDRKRCRFLKSPSTQTALAQSPLSDRQFGLHCLVMRWFSFPLGARGIGGCLLAMMTFGCSSEGRPPPSGGTCGADLELCDIHDWRCRQRVLDAVVCLRGGLAWVDQPETQFLQLSDLLEAAAVEEPTPDERTIRGGYALFGLVAPAEVADDAATAAALDSVAAFYSPGDWSVFIVENPGGPELSEADLGMPVEAYRMSVLAHEYVHFLQDLEFDLDEFTERLDGSYDSSLALISSIEGEAALYEGVFTFTLLGKNPSESRLISSFSDFIDYAEEAIRLVDSPWLEARSIFPYTYGAHSAAVLHAREGKKALEELRRSGSTLEYLQRRWDVASSTVPSTSEFETRDDPQLVLVDEEVLGPWLLNAFWSRATGASTEEALALALRWESDHMTIWSGNVARGDQPELVGQWVIELAAGAESDDDDTSRWVAELARSLGTATPPKGAASWSVRADETRLEVTASSLARSEAVSRLSETGGAQEVGVGDGGLGPSGALDGGAGVVISPPDSGDAGAASLPYQLPRALLASTGAGPYELSGVRLPKPSMLEHRSRTERYVRQLARYMPKATTPSGRPRGPSLW